MRKIAAVFVGLLLSVSAFGVTLQAQDHVGTVVTINSAECKNKAALARLPEVNVFLVTNGQSAIQKNAMRTGSMTFKNKQYGTCWIKLPFADLVLVIDDAGAENSINVVPSSDFAIVWDI